MLLQEIKPIHKKYPKTRVGRGGKRGTTSGGGQKGQKSRSGHRIRPAERDFIQRLPKLRGFKNKPNTLPAEVINLGRLEAQFKGTLVTPETLLEAGMIHAGATVKILGDGDLKKKLTFAHVKVSQSAKKKIEAAGGIIR